MVENIEIDFRNHTEFLHWACFLSTKIDDLGLESIYPNFKYTIGNKQRD